MKLPWHEYTIITSFQYTPFYQFIEWRVPDNWQHRNNYFNVPLPDFDIPAAAIFQEAREFRFTNGTTTDDHVVQMVAYQKFGDADWFLAKDPQPTSWEGKHHGYAFFHESYVKLKVLAFLVHRAGIPAIKQRLPEQPR